MDPIGGSPVAPSLAFDPSPAPAGLGWDGAWASSFAPHAASGLLPGRVVAAHRDAWRVALATGDRDAELSGRFRFEALGPGDPPAAGDWVALTDSDPALVSAVLPRRTAFGRNRDSGQAAADQAARKYGSER